MDKTQFNRILIIEDDPGIGASLLKLFEIEGFQTVWKNTGTEGMQYAREHEPNLILLDVRLPDGSGFDFCRQMRSIKLMMPILILTVQNDEIDKVIGLEMGADDYITKPFGNRELISRIRAHLRRAYGEFSGNMGDSIYIEDIRIDLVQGNASRGNTPLNLTPTEFKVLTYLARHIGQVKSRNQILDAVWGNDAVFMDEKVINVHIRRLREKVELDPGKPVLLLTVAGLGYRLGT